MMLYNWAGIKAGLEWPVQQRASFMLVKLSTACCYQRAPCLFISFVHAQTDR